MKTDNNSWLIYDLKSQFYISILKTRYDLFKEHKDDTMTGMYDAMLDVIKHFKRKPAVKDAYRVSFYDILEFMPLLKLSKNNQHLGINIAAQEIINGKDSCNAMIKFIDSKLDKSKKTLKENYSHGEDRTDPFFKWLYQYITILADLRRHFYAMNIIVNTDAIKISPTCKTFTINYKDKTKRFKVYDEDTDTLNYDKVVDYLNSLDK